MSGRLSRTELGRRDAQILEKEFEPVFDANDVANLGFAQAYIKATTKRTALPAFSIQVPAPLEVTNKELMRPKVAAALKQLSRLKHGRDRALVEQEIAERGKVGP